MVNHLAFCRDEQYLRTDEFFPDFYHSTFASATDLFAFTIYWYEVEVSLREWNGKYFCPEMKAPQTQMNFLLKSPIVDPCTYGCHFSYKATLPRQAFEFWESSNNNFSKKSHSIRTKSDLSVQKSCTAVSHPASIKISPVYRVSKKKDP